MLMRGLFPIPDIAGTIKWVLLFLYEKPLFYAEIENTGCSSKRLN